MSPLDYLGHQVESLAGRAGPVSEERHGVLLVLLGGGWEMLQSHFQAFPASSPVFWISVFWVLDWLLGSALALKRRNWSPTRAGYSVVKWLLWMAALAVAWGLRDSAFLGSTWIAAIMEAAILLAEGSSVLRNAAELSDNPLAKRLLGRFASVIEGRVDQLEQRLEAVEQGSTQGDKPQV